MLLVSFGGTNDGYNILTLHLGPSTDGVPNFRMLKVTGQQSVSLASLIEGFALIAKSTYAYLVTGKVSQFMGNVYNGKTGGFILTNTNAFS